MMRWSTLPVLLIFITLSACNSGSGGGEYYNVQGFTQGTTYHITYQHPSEHELQGNIDSLLKSFDHLPIVGVIEKTVEGDTTDG